MEVLQECERGVRFEGEEDLSRRDLDVAGGEKVSRGVEHDFRVDNVF